jgi:D-arabinose 1-dehydrogenase-like Zn-dependent alcohol dehydrogenase
MYVEQALAEYRIESDVCAVGLSFKDLLVAMGEIAQPGFRHEPVGIVRTIGSSVGGFLPGDRVVFFWISFPGQNGHLVQLQSHPFGSGD